MGSRGIKRRKPKRLLHDLADDLAPGDEQRVFGRFEYGNYTPMGNIEREGFLLRQLVRGGDGRGRDARRVATRLLVIAVLVLFVVSIVIGLVRR